MTRLIRVLVLGLLAQWTVATAAEAEAKADPAPAGGSSEGLVYEAIDKQEVITGNATKPAGKKPPVEGWWESKICTGEYCVYTNRKINKGRGLALVTKFGDYQKGENKIEDPSLFVETEVVDKGIGITAAKTVRRGKRLMSVTPVLLVHQDLFKDVKKRIDRKRVLEAAVAYLPDATREVFDRQRIQGLAPGDGRKKRSVEEIILGAPFEISLPFDMHAEQHSRHYAHYPEVAVVQHDCRPNVAWHIDPNFSLKLNVARRAQTGEELTMAYVDPFWPRYKRQAWVQKHRGLGKPCSCQVCSLKEEKLKESDARVNEIQDLLAKLRNHDSKDITEEMIDHFLALVDKEKLSTKLGEAYEYAALNYNYLGLDVKAKKYADLAVQAGIIEDGPEANNVVANRVFASDIKGHYSYRFTLKRRQNKN
ncbi:hypothetical protein QBC47DRAFT_445220 [Echria macrotheca]|uniref:SET domain-containing protein n=1 Tax=Echria macrotheca TaxID=438768 RepID=A0AAJ0BGT5_9PEZI|nr:hypothetical protein QBC47DRAFT_445220 [Echria macrotheca]